MSDLHTELYYAVCYRDNVKLKDLLARGISVNKHSHRGDTALRVAAATGNVEVTDLLIRNKADVNAIGYNNFATKGETALYRAVANGYADVVDLLIKNNADVNATGDTGETPLYKAVEHGNVQIAELLIRNKADLNSTGDAGETPLYKAIEHEKVSIAELLIRNKADLNSIGDAGSTPLHAAAAHSLFKSIDILIRNKADVNARDNNGSTPLHAAAAHGQVESIDLLIRNKADVNASDNNGSTPLHTAAVHGQVKSIDLLIRNKADVNASDNNGDSPLHQAASIGNKEMVEVLISLGANLSAVNKKGDTCLHQATSKLEQNMVEALVSFGVNLSAVNNEGKTPFDLAEDSYAQKRTSIDGYIKHRMIHHFLKEKSELLRTTRDKSHLKHTPNKDTSTLQATQRLKLTKEKDIQLPWLVDTEEFQRMLSHGTFLSYENRLSLGGPCRAGKSTLASVLIGEEIPVQWNSTDGLVIYFGRNGIDIDKKKMVPLNKGNRGHEVLAKIIRGKPDVFNKSEPKSGEQTAIPAIRSTSKLQNDNTSKSLIKEKTIHYTDTRPSTNELENKTRASNASSYEKHEGTEALGKDISSVKIDIQTLDCQKLQLQSDILDEVRAGKYSIEIAPSDLIDFGGQKSYDMTHQLFIQHTGSFLLMFDGRFGLHNQLDEYPKGVTAASILKHWVDSILTYTAYTDEIMPMILFAATHRDMCEGDTSKMRECFIEDIKQMFSSHEKRNHIHLETLYFINGVDTTDVEIQRMTDQIVIFAMRQTSWGQRRPMQWVPLELQISNMKMKNINILTKENLQQVNELNEDLALNKTQMDDFLLVQHSLGKLMYYNLPGLDKFIIIHPPALVNILRSFVTDEHFWPADTNLRSILQTMTNTGRIYKRDLLKIWEQPQFNQYMQEDAIKEFVLTLLVHLDILIVPKAFKQSSADVYLVPCMIKSIRPDFNNLGSQREKTICLQYTLSHTCIPSALAYKVIGAAVIAWPLKEENNKPCLYHKAAVLNVSEDDELRIWVDDNCVWIYLTNKKALLSISPDVAASIQECLTKNIESSLLFYSKSFGNNIKPTNVLELYTLTVGIPCGNDVCFTPIQNVNEVDNWKCDKDNIHDTRYIRYWIFNKSQQMCAVGCKGLSSDELGTEPSDKHLVRLGSQIGINSFEEFFIQLGMTTRQWENTIDMYGGHSREGIMSMALVKWKESKCSNLDEPTLSDLANALTAANLDKHAICQVFREKTKLLDIADFKLQETPSDDVLKELSNQIGNCALQLGIELGISFYEVEKSVVKFPKDLSGLIEDILNKWNATSKIKTTHSLMMALLRVDGGGVQYLHKITK